MKMNGAYGHKINFWWKFDDLMPSSSQYCPCCPRGIMDCHDGSLICRECQTIMPAEPESGAA